MFKIKSRYYFILLICSVYIANCLFLDINNDLIQQSISELSIDQDIYSVIKVTIILTQVASTIVTTIIIAYISSAVAYYKFDLTIKVSSFFKIASLVQSVQLIEAILAKLGENFIEYYSFSLGILIILLQLYILYHYTQKLVNKKTFSYSILGLYGFFILLGKSLTLLF